MTAEPGKSINVQFIFDHHEPRGHQPAVSQDQPLFALAGIWTEFMGDRGTKSKPVPGPHNVYGFLTTAPNAGVEPIRPRRCR
jgi:putative SOS response-associated peptidase YedK